MRFPPVLPHLPVSVPREYYNQPKRDRILQSAPTPDKQQKNLVACVAGKVNIDLLLDQRLLRLSPHILQAIAAFAEGDFVAHVDSQQYYVKVENGIATLCHLGHGRVVCQGNTADLFHYAAKYSPAAFRAVVQHARLGVIHPPEGSTLEETLTHYRRDRMYSKSLDLTSKMQQLALVDGDHVINKFNINPDLVCNEKALHVGSGVLTASSQRALHLIYDRVVCIDPNTVPGNGYIKEMFDVSKVKPGWDIISDAAFGDENGLGMTTKQQKDYVEQLYELSSEDRYVVAKVGLTEGLNIRANVLRKPRPHNLELIVELTPEGEPWADIYDRYHERVVDANKLRNEKMFKLDFAGEPRSVLANQSTIGQLLASEPITIPYPPGRKKWQVSRNTNIVRHGAAKRSAVRAKQWHNKCRDEDAVYDPSKPLVMLPLQSFKTERYFRDMDPGLEIDLSFNSVCATLTRKGLTYDYVNGEWQVLGNI